MAKDTLKKATTKEVAPVKAKTVAPTKTKTVAAPAKAKTKEVAKATVPAKAKTKEVAKPNPLIARFANAFEAVKVSIDKSKFGETEITFQTLDRLSAKQFGKIKTIAGKKLELTARGESWVLTYR